MFEILKKNKQTLEQAHYVFSIYVRFDINQADQSHPGYVLQDTTLKVKIEVKGTDSKLDREQVQHVIVAPTGNRIVGLIDA